MSKQEVYAKLTDACRYYNCSSANIAQRVSRGTLPFIEQGNKKMYLLSPHLKKRIGDAVKKKKVKQEIAKERKAFKEISKLDEKELENINHTKEQEICFEIDEKEKSLPAVVVNSEIVEEDNDEKDDEENEYNDIVPRQSLFTNPKLVEEALSTRVSITDTDRECIELFCLHYKDYLLYYEMARSNPIIKGMPNPMFRLAKEQWAIVNEYSKQLGIGIKNRLSLKVEAPSDVNPFQEFFE